MVLENYQKIGWKNPTEKQPAFSRFKIVKP